MARPVLGSDPFAPAGSPAGAEESPSSTRSGKTAAAPDRAAAKPVRPPRRKRAAPRPAAPTSEELDAKLQALEARFDSRFGDLESKLDAALVALAASPAGAQGNGESDGEVDEEEAFVGFLDAAPVAGPVADDDADDDDDEAFVGFLDDQPAAGEATDSSSTSLSDLDARERAHGPSFIGGLLDLLTPRGLGRRLGDFGLRGISDEVDEFGKDPVYVERVTQFLDWMYQKYWRVETEGLENVPDEGRGLIVGNHSGTLPFDGVMIATACRLHHPAERDVRALIEDMFATLPFVAPFMARVGAVRGCQENAERLLKQDELVIVFPEGVKGTGKYFHQRYQLQRFGRGGFIKLCLRTNAPLIPVAVVGSEEIYPIIAKPDWIGKPLGLPYTPITPTFPLLGLLGLVPLPTKWRIRFGEPMYFDEYGSEAIADDILINHLKEEVRHRIQEMVDDMLAERNSVWFG